MLAQDPEVGGAERTRGAHVHLLFHREDRTTRDASEDRHVDDADRDHRVGEAGPPDRDHGDRQQDRREREHDVHQAHQDRVDGTAVEAGHQPDGQAEQKRDPHRDESDLQ